MSADEHDDETSYEMGALEDDVLERDESLARHIQGGDERRWMILGGAGTLALMTALIAAVALGGSGPPHRLSSSLGGPARDASAIAAHMTSEASDADDQASGPSEGSSKSGAKDSRVAMRAPTASSAAAAPTPVSTPTATAPATASATAPGLAPAVPAPSADVPAAAPSQAAADEDDSDPLANLPSIGALEDAAPGADEPDDAADDFAHDDNPFEDASDDDASDDDDNDASDDDASSVPAPV